jgi:hypothetical protein
MPPHILPGFLIWPTFQGHTHRGQKSNTDYEIGMLLNHWAYRPETLYVHLGHTNSNQISVSFYSKFGHQGPVPETALSQRYLLAWRYL